MTERAPVRAYHQSLDGYKRLDSSLWGMGRRLQADWNEMEKQRTSALEEMLTNLRLGVCSRANQTHEGKTPRQKLGVFRRSELHLFYTRHGYCGAYDQEEVEERLELLCPQHLPPEDKWEYGGSHGPFVESSVLKRKGKLITKAGRRDVTNREDFPTLPNKIEPKYTEKIFEFFGLKPLPSQTQLISTGSGVRIG